MELKINLAVEYGSRDSELRADSNQRVLETVAKPTHERYGLGSTSLYWDDIDADTVAELAYLNDLLINYPLLDDDDYAEYVDMELDIHAHNHGLNRAGVQWAADYYGLDHVISITEADELENILMTAYGELPD